MRSQTRKPHPHLAPGELLRLGLGETSPEAAERLSLHVAGCAACRGQVDGFREVWGGLGLGAGSAEATASLWPRIAADLRGARPGLAGAPALRTWLDLGLSEAPRSPLFVAALLAVILGVGGGYVAARRSLGYEAWAASSSAEANPLQLTSLAADGESLASTYLADEFEALNADNGNDAGDSTGEGVR